MGKKADEPAPRPVADLTDPTFRQLMAKVRPLAVTPKHYPSPPQPKSIKRAQPNLSGIETYSLSDHIFQEPVQAESFLEYYHPSISKRQLRKLKQGDFPIAARLDLHSMFPDAARLACSEFIATCCRNNFHCVLLIHGKGNPSQPKLKNLVHNWLPQIPEILAYCSAPPKLGGTGAVLILLRRPSQT